MWIKERDPTEFGRWLAAEFEKRGITSQSEASRMLGLPQSTISRWLTGRGGGLPDPAKLQALTDVLGLDRSTVLAKAGHVVPASQEAQAEENPLLLRLAVLLGDHSPLSDADKDLLEKMIGKVMGGFR